jgi:hypothetical protein
MPTIDNRILFYNPSLGLYEVYAFRSGVFTKLQQKPITAGFTLVKGNGASIVFYHSDSGRLLTEVMTEDGSLSPSQDIAVHPSWTQIVGDGSNHLYYRADTGAAAITNAESGGTYPGTLANGWTHILESGERLFFYNGSNGAGAFDYFRETHDPGCTLLFCPPTGVGLAEYRGFPSGSFASGWTSIIHVDAGDALLFYRKSDGWSVIGDILISLGVKDRPGTARNLAAGWDVIVPIGDKLLFYEAFGGSYAFGHIEADGYHEDESHPGGLWGGFTCVVPCAFVSST